MSRALFFIVTIIFLSGCALKEEQYRQAQASEASDSLVRIADASFQAKNYAPALELYLRAYKKQKSDPLLEKIATTYSSMGDTVMALNAYTELYNKNPKNPIYIKNVAQAAFAAERFELSQRYYQKLLSIDSEDSSYIGAGIVEDVMGNHDKAQEYYQHVVNKSPRNTNAKNNLGLSFLLQGNLSQAESIFQDLTKRADNQPRFDMNLAFVYGISGNTAAAKVILARYLTPPQILDTLQFYDDYNAMNLEQRRRVVYGFNENPESVPVKPINDEVITEKSSDKPDIAQPSAISNAEK